MKESRPMRHYDSVFLESAAAGGVPPLPGLLSRRPAQRMNGARRYLCVVGPKKKGDPLPDRPFFS